MDDPNLIYISYTFIGIWGIGNTILIDLASLQGVPTELYEAAHIDGAGWWRRLWNITIPMITPVIFYNLILSLVGLLQYFIVLWVLILAAAIRKAKPAFYDPLLQTGIYLSKHGVWRLVDGGLWFRAVSVFVLFLILLSTIILPPAVTLVPTYAFFVKVLGRGGTWLPLIVPQMFGNAYNVFLLRQYFLTIPREMEEAALVVGAGRIRIFISVILPQAVPALTAVALFHFFFAWNDFFGPLIYLAGNRRANPITVGLTEFNGLYNTEPQLILAAAIISMILPLTIFFLAQRVFIQGIVITGVDK